MPNNKMPQMIHVVDWPCIIVVHVRVGSRETACAACEVHIRAVWPLKHPIHVD